MLVFVFWTVPVTVAARGLRMISRGGGAASSEVETGHQDVDLIAAGGLYVRAGGQAEPHQVEAIGRDVLHLERAVRLRLALSSAANWFVFSAAA